MIRMNLTKPKMLAVHLPVAVYEQVREAAFFSRFRSASKWIRHLIEKELKKKGASR